jgi:hypothetical protein
MLWQRLVEDKEKEAEECRRQCLAAEMIANECQGRLEEFRRSYNVSILWLYFSKFPYQRILELISYELPPA